MRWSWKLGKILGIDLYIHATFLLVILWVVLLHWAQGHSVPAMVSGVGFVLTVFACVVLHEFGHALAARRYGIATKDITLLPIGGVSRLERVPEEPWQEFWVSLAGPAVTVAIAGAIFVVLLLTSGWKPMSTLSASGGSFPQRVFVINLMLVAFNLLPAFPMDGGRIFRALLSIRMDHMRATQIAASVGQGLALLLGLGDLHEMVPGCRPRTASRDRGNGRLVRSLVDPGKTLPAANGQAQQCRDPGRPQGCGTR
jgi:Zn-dependent protease